LKTSVIIATHDRAGSLARLIASLAPQLVAGEREIIVAENGTPAPVPLPKVIESVAPLTRLHEPRAGKCRIQNRAIAQAQGEIIVMLDDDLTVAPTYLDAVEEFFRSHPEFAAMKGRILAADDPLKKVGPQWIYLDLPLVDHGEDVIEVRGVLGANMAFRTSALKQVGPFDERLGPGAGGHEEETEMSQRFRRAGLRIGYAPAAVVFHEVDPARADRQRFIRIARERGRCRMIHENHTANEVLGKVAIAWARLIVARAAGAAPNRIAREERRLAVARGMLDVIRQ
jgi:GT2 family glycosyltransferase